MKIHNTEIVKMQKGFTLIELMVVIVIIGILSALAIPKMFGVSAKAKYAEARGVIANWETLEDPYAQETGLGAITSSPIGFQQPGTITTAGTVSNTKWFKYTIGGTTAIPTMTAEVFLDFGDCTAGATGQLISNYAAGTDVSTHIRTHQSHLRGHGTQLLIPVLTFSRKGFGIARILFCSLNLFVP